MTMVPSLAFAGTDALYGGGDLATQVNSDNPDSEDTTSEAVFPSHGGVVEDRGGQPGETPSSEDTSDQPPRQSLTDTPPMEGNNNPIQENNGADADGDNDADVDFLVQPPRQSLTDTPPQEGNGDVELWALGFGDINVLAAGNLSLAGTTFAGATLDTPFVATNQDASANPRMLHVQTSGTAGTDEISVSGRKVIIELKNGLALKVAPGMVQSGADYNFDAAKLPTELKTQISNATYVRNAAIVLSNTTVTPRGGTLTYWLTDSASGFEADIQVANDEYFIAPTTEAGVAKSDMIVVTAEETVNGSDYSISDSLDSYKITGKVSIQAPGGVDSTYKAPGDSGHASWYTGAYYSPSLVSPVVVQSIFSKVSFEFKLSKGLVVPSNIDDIFTFSDSYRDIPAAAKEITLTEQLDGSTIVTLEITNLLLQAHNIILHYTVAEDAELGKAQTITAKSKTAFAYGDNNAENIHTETSLWGFNINIAAAAENGLLTVTPWSTASSKIAYVSPADMNADDNMFMGGFQINNASPSILTNQRLRLEFADSNIAIRSAKLPYGTDGKLTNLVVTTDKGTYTNWGTSSAPSSDYSKNTDSYGPCKFFNISDWTEDNTEKILSIEYTLATLGAGYSNGYNATNYAQERGATVFGRFTGENPGSYTYKVGVAIDEEGDETFDMVTSTFNTNVDRAITLQLASGPANNTVYNAGDVNRMSVVGSNAISGEATTVANSFYTKGIQFIIREMGILDVDTDSIELTDSRGTVYEEDKGVYEEGKRYYTVNTSTDGDGYPIVIISAPDLAIGNKSQGDVSNANIEANLSYDFKVKKTTPTKSVLASDMIYLRALSPSVDHRYPRLVSYQPLNVHDVLNDGRTADRFGSLNVLYNYQIQGIKEFSVATYAKRIMGDNDSDWKAYDSSDESRTILGANEYSRTFYRVQVSNQTTNPAGNFVVHVPIPREGENFGSQYFNWSAAILDEVDTTDSDVNISYSKIYVADTTQAGSFDDQWKDTDAEDYRTIRIEKTVDIPKETVINYDFELGIIETDSTIESLGGQINNYYSIFSSQIGANIASNGPSQPVAMRLDTAVVVGKVFNDLNKDGDFDDTGDTPDTPRGGVNWAAYEQGHQGEPDYRISYGTSDPTDGSFVVTNLKNGEKIDLVLANPGYVASGTDTTRYYDGVNATTHSANKVLTDIVASGSTDPIEFGLITPYTVKFYPEGGTPAPSDQKVYKGDTATEPTVTREGYNFDGSWKVGSVGGGDWTASTPVTSDLNLYAKWNVDSANSAWVTVDFNGNGNGTTVTGVPTTLHYNTVLGAFRDGETWPTATPLRSGYTFVEWNNATGTASTAYTASSQFTANTIVYAKWNVDSASPAWVTVDFNGNGNGTTVTGVPETLHYNTMLGTFRDGETWPTATPLRTGYTFAEWNNQTGDAGSAYTGTSTYAADTTVYAKWNVDSANSAWVTVDFNGNGNGTTVTDVPTTLHYNTVLSAFRDGETWPTATPLRSGYTFVEWNNQTGNASSAYTGISTYAANTTVYAKWTIDEDATKPGTSDPVWATVSFNGNGNGTTVTGVPTTLHYNTVLGAFRDGETWPTATPLRTGYTFVEWNNQTGDASSAYTGTSTYAADTTVYAKWNVDSANSAWVTVDFNGNGNGTTVTGVPTTLHYNTVLGAFRDGETWPTATPLRTGYTFAEWNNQTGDASSAYTGASTYAANTTVYAKWTIDEDATKPGTSDPVWATVSFNANGGTGAPSDILYNTTEKKFADGISFPTAKPNLSGYTFVNWNTQQDKGKGSIVTGAQSLSSITGNTTLYAIWNANGNTPYKVEHYLVDAGGSASLKETVGHTAKTDTTANATAKTYDHYTLNSAHNSAVSSGNVAGDGSLVLKLYYGINHNVVSYSVTGTVPEGAPAAPAASDVAYGQTVNVASALAFDGYTFSGWTADGVSGASFTMPDSAVVFTGSWTLIDNGGGDNGGTGGGNDGNDDENGNDDDDTVVNEPKEPKAPAVKDKTEVAFTPTKNYTPRQQAMIEKNPQIEAFIEKAVPVASIGNTDVPLYGLAGVDSWALSNALLAGFSLIIAAIALLNATVRRKALGGVDKDRGGIRFPLIVAAFALAIVNMALFFTIEDTSAIMTLIDGWSVASVALTGGVVFLSKLAFRRPVAAE
jgi:uncharacterized repeat protein (TIGR02543 family)